MTPQRKTLIHINYVGLLLEVSETSHAYGCECMHERMSASRLLRRKKSDEWKVPHYSKMGCFITSLLVTSRHLRRKEVVRFTRKSGPLRRGKRSRRGPEADIAPQSAATPL